MPAAREWTKEADGRIRQGRADGETWGVIAVALGLSRNTVIERGRRLGAARGDVNRAFRECSRERFSMAELNREPLPAGHALTWGLLSDAPYPHELMRR